MTTQRDQGIDSILVVDDTPVNLEILARTLKARGHRVRPVLDGQLALDAARAEPPSLVLVDIHMPGLSGFEVCAELKKEPALAHIPVIFISANTDASDKAQAFAAGGVDYVTKPFQVSEVLARVDTHLKLARLERELAQSRDEPKRLAQAQREATSCFDAMVAVAELAEARDADTSNHLVRVQRYCRILMTHLEREAAFAGVIDETFTDQVARASVLHDIGKAGVPDAVLLKPGELSPAEFEVMRRHAELGARALGGVLQAHPDNGLLRSAADIAAAHHERWDGGGYPRGLSGEAIPLAARVVALADQYDALRSKRPHKPPLDAPTAYRILTEGDGRTEPRHFDPRVLAAFKIAASELDSAFQALPPTVAGAAPGTTSP